jgi:hypothetical protein
MTSGQNFSSIRDDQEAHNAVRDLAPPNSQDIVHLVGVIINDNTRIIAMSEGLFEDLSPHLTPAKSLEDFVVDFAQLAEEDPADPGRLVATPVPTFCRNTEVLIEILGPGWAWIGYPDESRNR